MSPAFSSRGHAVLLALLLATLLGLPGVMAETGWLRRQDVYSTVPARFGPFPWIQKEIYFDHADVDIAFIGSSHIWCDVDTPYVQKALTARVGRRAEVVTLGWPWGGFDELYLVARDLLDHRRVQTLVIYDESSSEDVPHQNSSRLFRIGENSEALRGLPLLARVRLYGGAVLGMPRHVLSLLRPDLPEDQAIDQTDFWSVHYHAPLMAEQLGSLRARLSFGHDPHFAQFAPTVQASPLDALIYGDETRASFRFTSSALNPYQRHFALELAQLCRRLGTHLVVLHTPSFSERDQAVITERVPWPDILGSDVDVVGIPSARMFAGMSSGEVKALFFENGHLNQNGQDVFTPLLTPALLKLHAHSRNR
jgi:hypothetical protein